MGNQNEENLSDMEDQSIPDEEKISQLAMHTITHEFDY
jgi:hypothetical protein